MTPPQHLKIAICPILTKEQAQRLADADPRIEVLWDETLSRPRRFAADFDGDPAWQRTPEVQARFEAMCDGADALFGLPDAKPAQLKRCAEANPNLIWVHTLAAGGGAQVKNAGLTPDELARITVTTSAGAHAPQLAEFALLGVLAGAKRLPLLQQQQRDHVWARLSAPALQVADMTVVVVGMGNVGRLVAQRFLALGATVIGVNRSMRDVPGVEMHTDDDLIEVATRADALINCLPAAVGTEGLINADVFAAVKPGVIVSSIGRGSCIDEAAMIAGLQDGRVGFAALDVVAKEPLAGDSPLWAMPNVLISPHTMAFNRRVIDRVIDMVAANAIALLDGRPMVNDMNKELFY